MKNASYKTAWHQSGEEYARMCVLGPSPTTCKQWFCKGDGVIGFIPFFLLSVSFIPQTLACYYVSDMSMCFKFS